MPSFCAQEGWAAAAHLAMAEYLRLCSVGNLVSILMTALGLLSTASSLLCTSAAGARAAHLAMAGYLRCRDPGRPVHYEGGGSRTPATDFVCPMYARVHQARAPRRPARRPAVPMCRPSSESLSYSARTLAPCACGAQGPGPLVCRVAEQAMKIYPG